MTDAWRNAIFKAISTLEEHPKDWAGDVFLVRILHPNSEKIKQKYLDLHDGVQLQHDQIVELLLTRKEIRDGYYSFYIVTCDRAPRMAYLYY